MTQDALDKYLQQLSALKSVADESSRRVVEDADALFTSNANFFAKSYLITLCSILETYLKEEVAGLIGDANGLLAQVKLAKNIVLWGVFSRDDEHYRKYEDKANVEFALQIDSTEVDDRLSGNVGRTLAAFRRCGLSLDNCVDFKKRKDQIGAIVSKRNDAVHHSDDSSDFTFNDVIGWIAVVKDYILGISQYVQGERAFHLGRLQFLQSLQANEGGQV